MKAMSPNQFAEQVLSMADPVDPFVPQITYDPDGDCVEFLTEPDNFYAERIDGLVTVYYSEETGEIIGSLIKGVRSFCNRILKTMPGSGIEIRDGKIQLRHLFTGQLWSQAEPAKQINVLAYRKLRELAEKAEAEVQLSEV